MIHTKSTRMLPPREYDAPLGSLWVCMMCGKISDNKYWIREAGSHGWDGSCMMNSRLFEVGRLKMEGDRVTHILKDA